MKYFRTYPYGLQVLLFALMAFTFISAAGVILGSLLPRFGISAAQLSSIGPNTPIPLIESAIVVQGLSSIFVWMLPAFIFAYLAHPRPLEYLGLRAPGKIIQPVLAVLIILGAMPVLELIEGLIGQINFSPAIKAEQKANDDMMTALLTMPNFGAFIKVFVVMAIVPALGEEIFFRGILMRFLKKKNTTMVFPVLLTAGVFALAHSQVYGLISIFLAGVLLAVIYNLTGSLWCSILAHLFFNGTQIILSYAGNNNAAIKQYMNNTEIPYYLVIGGAAVFCISFYLLIKNKTPLPPNWTNDYTIAELQAEQRERERSNR